jgi:hypothetical protein
VEAVDGLDYRQNLEETDGIAWFTKKELVELETIPEVKREAGWALAYWQKRRKNVD